jgi:hypothetical protein
MQGLSPEKAKFEPEKDQVRVIFWLPQGSRVASAEPLWGGLGTTDTAKCVHAPSSIRVTSNSCNHPFCASGARKRRARSNHAARCASIAKAYAAHMKDAVRVMPGDRRRRVHSEVSWLAAACAGVCVLCVCVCVSLVITRLNYDNRGHF